MARRKKTDTETVVTDAPQDAETTAEPTEFIPPSLTEVERLRLKLAESELQRYLSDAKVHEVHRLLLLKRIDPQGQLEKLDSALRTASTAALRSKQVYADVVKGIETRLKIKLSDYSFDDETGTLIPH